MRKKGMRSKIKGEGERMRITMVKREMLLVCIIVVCTAVSVLAMNAAPVGAQPLEIVFDTGEGAYPSIMGVHKGYFTPKHDISVYQIYTYPCAGTGGHSEYVAFYENGNEIGDADWGGYQGDYHNIRFDDPLTLYKGVVYSCELRTGSYPQIIHNQTLTNDYGTINCTSFVDANGRSYNDWIPAIRLEGYFVDGEGVHNQNTGENFSTIQSAIDDPNTQDGHTIVVYAGTYVENVNVTKRLTLRGIGMPTVDANGAGSAITVSADGCMVEGFNVTGAISDSGSYYFAGIKVTSGGNSLINNMAMNNNHGIFLWSWSYNNTLTNNVVHSNRCGIRLSGLYWEHTRCINNTLTENTVTNNQHHGILLEFAIHNIITNNRVSKNKDGISVCFPFTRNNTITDNTIKANSRYGIQFTHGANENLIYHNNIENNSYQALDSGYDNSWDNGPTEGGNYWSDHECTGNPSDGGQPYYILGDDGAQDRYPFEDRWGWHKA